MNGPAAHPGPVTPRMTGTLAVPPRRNHRGGVRGARPPAGRNPCRPTISPAAATASPISISAVPGTAPCSWPALASSGRPRTATPRSPCSVPLWTLPSTTSTPPTSTAPRSPTSPSARRSRPGDDALVDLTARQGVAYVAYLPLGGFTPLQSDALQRTAGRIGATPMAVALAWLLQRSPNILLIPGTSSVAHLRENVASAALQLPPDATAQLDAIGR